MQSEWYPLYDSVSVCDVVFDVVYDVVCDVVHDVV